MEDWIQRYGDFFVYHKASRSCLVITDLDLLKMIFISDRNFSGRPLIQINAKPLANSLLWAKNWQAVKQIMSPFFTRARVRNEPMFTIIGESIDRYLHELNPSERREAFDEEIQEKVHCFSYEIILKVFLGMQADLYHKDKALMEAVKGYFDTAHNGAVDLADVFPFFRNIFAFINNFFTAGKLTDFILAHLKKYLKNAIDAKIEAPLLPAMIEAYKKGKLDEDEFLGKQSCRTWENLLVDL